ncbi:response regulator transcription factor [Clostridium cibarium]|uniref:Stage 0 sporulation protein A homolog n=1 Tax=Clostridium cibarium TaxID=2762247 RepID=A0ABR8PXC9_9CLOT|nr:response regulator transcription factor [Clostridium cibarium]MBD7912811.1 response regulator transcription factor [Clostridium cibarium]
MKLLVVEDDEFILESIKCVLEEEFQVDVSMNGEEGLFLAKQDIYDLIILDIMLPDMDGFSILKNLKAVGINTPVLLLSAKGAADDRIKGLSLGADDYLTKPFHIEELVLRVKAILRRYGQIHEENSVSFMELSLIHRTKQVFIKDEEIKMQVKQFNLLEYLILNEGTILLKEQIYDRIWGLESDTTLEIVEVYIHNIRKKLMKYGYDKYIKTIRGVGYLLQETEK